MSNQGPALVVFGAVVLLSVPIMMAFVFIAASRAHRQKVAEWREMPTLDEYLANNPNCKTDQGPACNQCHATNLLNRGLSNSPDSKQRILTCENCHTPLFRSGA